MRQLQIVMSSNIRSDTLERVNKRVNYGTLLIKRKTNKELSPSCENYRSY